MSVAAPPNLALQRHLLHGLADNSRLSILRSVLAEERRVREVVEETGLSQPNVSKHLACLWGCGLVAREKRGREVYYRAIEGVDELFAAIDGVLERAGETVGSCPLTVETVACGR
jgi:DNA-binding transcriptional ArsR family regulator